MNKCKNIMKLIVIFLIGIFFASPLKGDQAAVGSDYQSFPGDIFIKDEHPYVALERQLMIVDILGNNFLYYIYYEFYNHSNKAETLNVAFPIELEFNWVGLDIEENVLNYTFQYSVNDGILKILRKIFKGYITEYIEEGYITEYMEGSMVAIKDPFSINKLVELDTIPFSFYVEQDGKQIKNLNAKAYINWEEAEHYQYGSISKIRIYIFYTLIFNPQSTSKVIVKYDAPALSYGESESSYITQSYLIGPGAKWKGKIKEFLLFKAYLYRGAREWYLEDKFVFKVNYEPENNEMLEFEIREDGYDDYNEILVTDTLMNYTPGENVKIIGYSSYVPEKTKVFRYSRGYIEYLNEYLNEGYLKFDKEDEVESDFYPQRLFDRDPRTAWCTNLKKDTLRYVDVELENDVRGISIINGFLKNNFPPVGLKLSEDGGIFWAEEDRDGYYPVNPVPDSLGVPINLFGHSYLTKKSMAFANASAAKIEITGLDENNKFIKHIMKLPKITANAQSVFYHADIPLPKGKYRIRVLDYYKGDKYEDLCIGEVIFHRKIQTLNDIIVKYNIPESFVDILGKYISEKNK